MKDRASRQKKKRKNTTKLMSEVSIEVKKVKAAKTEEYQAQLATRTAAPPTKAASRASSAPATGISGTGYDRIHPSHKRCRFNGEVVFCWECGYWMVNKSQNLSKPCDPDFATMTANQKSIRDYKLRKCLHPTPTAVARWKDGACTSKLVPLERLDPS